MSTLTQLLIAAILAQLGIGLDTEKRSTDHKAEIPVEMESGYRIFSREFVKEDTNCFSIPCPIFESGENC